MTAEPEPIRRSDLPPIPSPESEVFTWFPHPDGGGDMVRGQRQRGVQVRRRISYSDWEPVRPDHWADEPAGQGASADAAAQPPYRALLARLEQEQAKAERNAPLCRIEEVRWVNEGMAAAHRIDAAHVLAVFEGPEAAAAYMRGGGEPGPSLAPGFVNPPGSTAEQLPADVLELVDPAPYLSTACGTAQALEEAAAEHPERRASLLEWADRLHQRCRENQKFTGQDCACGHHAARPVDAHPDDAGD
ncbi:hypothetical protein ACWY4P_40700 [Streptomyces sp. LZ34]